MKNNKKMIDTIKLTVYDVLAYVTMILITILLGLLLGTYVFIPVAKFLGEMAIGDDPNAIVPGAFYETLIIMVLMMLISIIYGLFKRHYDEIS